MVKWSNSDLDSLDWKATYMTDEIPADDDWDTFATRNKKNLEKMYKDLGVPKEGSLHYMCICPNLSERLQSIIRPYKGLVFNYNFLKLTPGCSLMWHFDTYATFVKFNDIAEEDIDNVCRTITMMYDWEYGQVFQVDNKVHTHWKAGDTYTWRGSEWHGMSNFGLNNIIISQVTFLDE